MPKNSIKTADQIKAIRVSGRMLASVLELLRRKTTNGMTPKDASALAQAELAALGGQPAFKGYMGYPDIICISVNNQVQHSIPTNVPLKAGDVVNYDFGVIYDGMITDAGITVCVDGSYTPDSERLITGTQRALNAGLHVVKAGVRVGDISAAIEGTLKQYRLGIVRELVGHGVGNHLHEDPEIPNYGLAGQGPILRAGMTIAIEPITTLGRADIYQAGDGWTLLTQDGSLSAQFEHTVLVTEEGCEILTTV